MSTFVTPAQRDTWLVTALVETHSGLAPKISCAEGVLRVSKMHRLRWEVPVAKPEVREEAEDLTISGTIVTTVCHMFRIKREQMMSRTHSSRIMLARHLAIYCCRQIARLSTTQCGIVFGRDHSTILSALRKIEKMRSASKEFDARVERVLRACRIACASLNLEELP